MWHAHTQPKHFAKMLNNRLQAAGIEQSASAHAHMCKRYLSKAFLCCECWSTRSKKNKKPKQLSASSSAREPGSLCSCPHVQKELSSARTSGAPDQTSSIFCSFCLETGKTANVFLLDNTRCQILLPFTQTNARS